MKVMDLLAKGANPNYQDHNLSTPLMNAVYGGTFAIGIGIGIGIGFDITITIAIATDVGIGFGS